MEKNHPVSELMSETIQRIREAVDANTVVGTPIVAGEITLIPVSRISLGFGTAGSEVGGKTPKALGENPFGGGGGAGLKIIPVCFLVVSGGMVKVLSVDAAPETSLDRVVDLIPDIVNKITSVLEVFGSVQAVPRHRRIRLPLPDERAFCHRQQGVGRRSGRCCKGRRL